MEIVAAILGVGCVILSATVVFLGLAVWHMRVQAAKETAAFMALRVQFDEEGARLASTLAELQRYADAFARQTGQPNPDNTQQTAAAQQYGHNVAQLQRNGPPTADAQMSMNQLYGSHFMHSGPYMQALGQQLSSAATQPVRRRVSGEMGVIAWLKDKARDL